MENMKVDNPNAFMNFDFGSLSGRLPAPEIAKYQQQATALRKGDAGMEADNKQAKDIKDSVQDMLPRSWLSSKLDPTSSDGQNYQAFNGMLINNVRDAAATGGKPLARDDVRKMASDMLQDVSVHRDNWFDASMKPYQIPAGTPPQNVYRGSTDNIYVPESFRTGFSRAWQNKMGAAPAEADIRLGYLKSTQPAGQ